MNAFISLILYVENSRHLIVVA